MGSKVSTRKLPSSWTLRCTGRIYIVSPLSVSLFLLDILLYSQTSTDDFVFLFSYRACSLCVGQNFYQNSVFSRTSSRATGRCSYIALFSVPLDFFLSSQNYSFPSRESYISLDITLSSTKSSLAYGEVLESIYSSSLIQTQRHYSYRLLLRLGRSSAVHITLITLYIVVTSIQRSSLSSFFSSSLSLYLVIFT